MKHLPTHWGDCPTLFLHDIPAVSCVIRKRENRGKQLQERNRDVVDEIRDESVARWGNCL